MSENSIPNGRISPPNKDNEILEAMADTLISLESKSELKEEIMKILCENSKLKSEKSQLESRVSQLEEDMNNSDRGFVIETEPMDENESESLSQSRYEQQFQEVLSAPLPEGQEPPVEDKTKVKGNACWNCDKEGCNVRDCPLPRNQKKIAEKRREQQKKINLNTRYHVDEAQKFGHLKPGLPSKNLRRALGLKGGRLPSYIYRMREKGYPPGWLKAAEINHSNVALFVNQEQALPDHGDEDGEIADAEDKKQYDISRIQEWPGFNVKLDEDFQKNFSDETERYRVKPIRDDQSKDEMVKKMSLKEQKGYVRGEMQDTSTKKTEKNDELLKTPSGEIPEIQTTPARLETKTIDNGTPIVQMHSPFTNLPKSEKWTTQTTDHIMFENLPDSTGKWDQMSSLIKGIREKQKSLKE